MLLASRGVSLNQPSPTGSAIYLASRGVSINPQSTSNLSSNLSTDRIQQSTNPQSSSNQLGSSNLSSNLSTNRISNQPTLNQPSINLASRGVLILIGWTDPQSTHTRSYQIQVYVRASAYSREDFLSPRFLGASPGPHR